MAVDLEGEVTFGKAAELVALEGEGTLTEEEAEENEQEEEAAAAAAGSGRGVLLAGTAGVDGVRLADREESVLGDGSVAAGGAAAVGDRRERESVCVRERE